MPEVEKHIRKVLNVTEEQFTTAKTVFNETVKRLIHQEHLDLAAEVAIIDAANPDWPVNLKTWFAAGLGRFVAEQFTDDND